MRFKNKNLKGSAIAYALTMTATVAIILASMVQYVVSQMKYGFYSAAKEEAFQIAESGIYFYRWYLAHEVEGRTASQVKAFWEGNPAPVGVGTPACGQNGAYEVEYKDPSGSALGKYCLEVTPPANGSTIVSVKSVGWTYKYPDAKRTLKVRYRKPSWSEYAVLGNGFTGFGGGTEIFGKLKANGGIRFDGVAHNVVYSQVETVNDPDHGGADEHGVHTHVSAQENLPPNPVPDLPGIFEAGRQFPVAETSFSAVQADMNLIKQVAIDGTDGSVYFDNAGQGRHIVFNGTTFNVRTVQAFNANTNQIISYNGSWTNNLAIPNNGVVFVEGNVWLQGNLSGRRVTVVAANLVSASQKSVYLGMGNITYSTYDGADVLGVIAQKDVAFVKNSLNTLQVDGALLAQSGRFGFWFRNPGSGQARGCIQNSCGSCAASCVNPCRKTSITLNGAIATNERYALYLGDACALSGYPNRNINYDNNLLYAPPPYFPVGDQYLMDLWEEL